MDSQIVMTDFYTNDGDPPQSASTTLMLNKPIGDQSEIKPNNRYRQPFLSQGPSVINQRDSSKANEKKVLVPRGKPVSCDDHFNNEKLKRSRCQAQSDVQKQCSHGAIVFNEWAEQQSTKLKGERFSLVSASLKSSDVQTHVDRSSRTQHAGGTGFQKYFDGRNSQLSNCQPHNSRPDLLDNSMRHLHQSKRKDKVRSTNYNFNTGQRQPGRRRTKSGHNLSKGQKWKNRKQAWGKSRYYSRDYRHGSKNRGRVERPYRKTTKYRHASYRPKDKRSRRPNRQSMQDNHSLSRGEEVSSDINIPVSKKLYPIPPKMPKMPAIHQKPWNMRDNFHHQNNYNRNIRLSKRRPNNKNFKQPHTHRNIPGNRVKKQRTNISKVDDLVSQSYSESDNSKKEVTKLQFMEHSIKSSSEGSDSTLHWSDEAFSKNKEDPRNNSVLLSDSNLMLNTGEQFEKIIAKGPVEVLSDEPTIESAYGESANPKWNLENRGTYLNSKNSSRIEVQSIDIEEAINSALDEASNWKCVDNHSTKLIDTEPLEITITNNVSSIKSSKFKVEKLKDTETSGNFADNKVKHNSEDHHPQIVLHEDSSSKSGTCLKLETEVQGASLNLDVEYLELDGSLSPEVVAMSRVKTGSTTRVAGLTKQKVEEGETNTVTFNIKNLGDGTIHSSNSVADAKDKIGLVAFCNAALGVREKRVKSEKNLKVSISAPSKLSKLWPTNSLLYSDTTRLGEMIINVVSGYVGEDKIGRDKGTSRTPLENKLKFTRCDIIEGNESIDSLLSSNVEVWKYLVMKNSNNPIIVEPPLKGNKIGRLSKNGPKAVTVELSSSQHQNSASASAELDCPSRSGSAPTTQKIGENSTRNLQKGVISTKKLKQMSESELQIFLSTIRGNPAQFTEQQSKIGIIKTVKIQPAMCEMVMQIPDYSCKEVTEGSRTRAENVCRKSPLHRFRIGPTEKCDQELLQTESDIASGEEQHCEAETSEESNANLAEKDSSGIGGTSGRLKLGFCSSTTPLSSANEDGVKADCINFEDQISTVIDGAIRRDSTHLNCNIRAIKEKSEQLQTQEKPSKSTDLTSNIQDIDIVAVGKASTAPSNSSIRTDSDNPMSQTSSEEQTSPTSPTKSQQRLLDVNSRLSKEVIRKNKEKEQEKYSEVKTNGRKGHSSKCRYGPELMSDGARISKSKLSGKASHRMVEKRRGRGGRSIYRSMVTELLPKDHGGKKNQSGSKLKKRKGSKTKAAISIKVPKTKGMQKYHVQWGIRQKFAKKLFKLASKSAKNGVLDGLKNVVLSVEAQHLRNTKTKQEYQKLANETCERLKCDGSDLVYYLPNRPELKKPDTPLERMLMQDINFRDHWYPHAYLEGYVQTPKKGEVSGCHGYDLVGLDCEMVLTKEGSQLARVTLCGKNLRTIYDVYVRPSAEVVDYLTSLSGITKDMLNGVTRTVADVQRDLFLLIDSETVVVGHSLEMDFWALRLIHPRVVDTAVLYMSVRIKNRMFPEWLKLSLKKLAHENLDLEIQEQKGGHDSAEDARAALMLVLRRITMESAGIWRKPNPVTYECDPALRGKIYPGGPLKWRPNPNVRIKLDNQHSKLNKETAPGVQKPIISRNPQIGRERGPSRKGGIRMETTAHGESMRGNTQGQVVSNLATRTTLSKHHFFAKGVWREDKDHSVLACLGQLRKQPKSPEASQSKGNLSKVTITKGNTTITIEGEKPSSIRCGQDGVVIVGNDGSIQEIRSTSPLSKTIEGKKISRQDYNKDMDSCSEKDLQQGQFNGPSTEVVDLTMFHSNHSQIMNIMPDNSYSPESRERAKKNEKVPFQSHRKRSVHQKCKSKRNSGYGKRASQNTFRPPKYRDERRWVKLRSKFSRQSRKNQTQHFEKTTIDLREHLLSMGSCSLFDEKKMSNPLPDTLKNITQSSMSSYPPRVSISSSTTTDNQSNVNQSVKEDHSRGSPRNLDLISSISSPDSSDKQSSNKSAVSPTPNMYQTQTGLPSYENSSSEQYNPTTRSISKSGYTSTQYRPRSAFSLTNAQRSGSSYNYNKGSRNFMSSYRRGGFRPRKGRGTHVSNHHSRKLHPNHSRKQHKQRSKNGIERKKGRKPVRMKNQHAKSKKLSAGFFIKNGQKDRTSHRRNSYNYSFTMVSMSNPTSRKCSFDSAQLKKECQVEDGSADINDRENNLLSHVFNSEATQENDIVCEESGGKEMRRIFSKGSHCPSWSKQKKRRRQKPFNKSYGHHSVDGKHFKQNAAKIIQNIVHEKGVHLSVSQQSEIIQRVCEKVAKTRPKRWSPKNLNRINRAVISRLVEKYVDCSTSN